MTARITAVDTVDVRFPTSTTLDGSDAMNPDPDYSAAYLLLRTDRPDGATGHGFTFTIGRGNELMTAAVGMVASALVGLPLRETLDRLGPLSRSLVHDSQWRWLGPEKGVAHMAVGAVLNALWDLKARLAGVPLWKLLADHTPEQLVELVDFRYLTDALTPAEAHQLLTRARAGRTEREAALLAQGYPAYTTTPGWLGYDDEKLVRLARGAVDDGFTQIKLKVGANVDADERRLSLARDAIGPHVGLAIDANQRWDVEEAVRWVRRLQRYDLAWIEEPTSPDDVLAHAEIRRRVAPVKVATGEHAHNRVLVKQLLQSHAVDVLQIDATRVAGVNENLANLLLAAKFGVPVCPHAGGVGLCEVVQHLAMFDYLAVTGTWEGRWLEYSDHLHEHFEAPAVVRGGRYLAPTTPGSSAAILPASLRDHTYPGGSAWQARGSAVQSWQAWPARPADSSSVGAAAAAAPGS